MKPSQPIPPKRRPKPLKRVGAATVIEENLGDDRLSPIVERPDGFHWIAADGKREFGPFATYEEARADRDAEAAEGGQALQEAESDLGISDWIDPDTGEPAEGLSRPHIDDN